jgi:PPOX class probable F420-dependent enzyme
MTALRAIPAEAQVLLGSSALAHVVTVDRHGRPQVSVVWCGVRGDEVVFCAEASSAKVRNIRRDPKVILSIEDDAKNIAGTQQHLLVHGTARVLGPADRAVCDDLCRTYAGTADTELNLSRSPTAVTVAVTVERLAGNGPWAGSADAPAAPPAAAPPASKDDDDDDAGAPAPGGPPVPEPSTSHLGSRASGLRGR